MKVRFLLLLWASSLLLALTGCSSGKSALVRGDYEESSYKAMERLRSSATNKKALETLRQSYPLAIDTRLKQIDALAKANRQFKWEEIAGHYSVLNNLYDELQRCPAGLRVIHNSRSYLSEYQDAMQMAAEERYTTGLIILDAGDKKSAREAFQHFKRADELVPNYRDARAKREEAFQLATWRVLVDEIPMHSRSLQLSNEFFQNNIYEYLRSDRMNDFVRFYTPAEARAENLMNPDHYIRLQFDDFVVGQTFVQEKIETFTKDSVVVGEATIEGKKVPVYGTVKATLKTYKKVVESKGLLDMQIYDATSARILLQEKMPGSYTWYTEWASFNGDERALTKAQLELTKRREVAPPPPQDLFISFCQPIYTQVTQKIRRYYQSF